MKKKSIKDIPSPDNVSQNDENIVNSALALMEKIRTQENEFVIYLFEVAITELLNDKDPKKKN